MPPGRRRGLRTAVIVGGAAHVGAKSAQKKQDAQQPAQAAVDPAVEIEKYKKLLDDGTITQQEFDAKKKELLGL